MQGLLVGLIVLVAAVYTVWGLMPATTRRNLALRAARDLGGPDPPGERGRIAGALLRSGQSAKGCCGGCPAQFPTPAKRASEHKQPRI